MNRKFNNNNYDLVTVATISFIPLFSTIPNPIFGYDLDDVKSSIAYEEAIEDDLPTNTKNFSMELDNGLIANYYLAPNQTYVFDGLMVFSIRLLALRYCCKPKVPRLYPKQISYVGSRCVTFLVGNHISLEI
jgi:hypothetical protein